jgi:SPP1 gp7 family putative phage head morphogenesis protein
MNKRQKLIQQQFLNNEKGVIKDLDKTYSKALGDINDKIKNLTFTIGELQQEYDWMDDTDPKKAQVKSMIQSKIYQKQYQEQLRSQVDGILNQMQISQFVSVSDYLDTCYTDGFIGTIFDAQGQGVPILAPINQESMVRAVQLESKISKGLYTKLGEDVALLKKKITAEVSRGISTGMTFKQVATNIKNQSRVGYNKAIRIARTEGHRVQTTATMDAMEAAKEKGADVLKQWDSTLDGKTRESHQAVDGEIRELDKPFSNGLMYPGDPSGGASEVVNCRCALLQRARWALEDEDEGFTKFNGFTDQLETFDSPKDYGEFKKAFF